MQDTLNAQPGKFLTFRLRGQIYGAPIASIREINRLSEITPVPQAPTFVAGVVNLRGKVVPVIDLRLKLGMEAAKATNETCIVVVDADHGQVGMIVDSVSGVVDLEASQIEPRPHLGGGGNQDVVMGMGKVENQVMILLAIGACLSSENLGRIMEVATLEAAA